jgi:hypothetical protein
VDSVWKLKKLEATLRELLENAAESPASSAPTKKGMVILYERNKGAIEKVYSEAASMQAEESSGDMSCCSPAVHRGFQSN